jgi:predicted O-methyltransferase YrrM
MYKAISFKCDKILGQLVLFLDKYRMRKWKLNPLGFNKNLDESFFLDLWESVKCDANREVDKIEKSTGHVIDKNWLDDLALRTQVVKKDSDISYHHGRVLYSFLSEYIRKSSASSLNIVETGTARGFSALCMAKALSDSNVFGKIVTFDILPHASPIYWNNVTDTTIGKLSRIELLEAWTSLIEKYVLFVTGDTRNLLDKYSMGRVHFAFFDGSHTYNDVIFEFNSIKNKQKSGDIIVYDDYSKEHYPDIVKAVDYICEKYSYSMELISLSGDRSCVIARKV